MVDMLVTTPQSEIDTSRREGEIVEEEGGYWFRTFRFKPKVEIGEKIFFVEAGLIKGYGIVFEVSPTEGGVLAIAIANSLAFCVARPGYSSCPKSNGSRIK